MLGYIIAVLLIVYFFVFWPRFENLPPRSMRIRKQRLAGDFGLHNTPSVGKLTLSDLERNELLSNITFIDHETYSKICKSKQFYLVESRKSVLSLYCSVNEYIDNVNYSVLQSPNFIKIPIEEHLLVRFLKELNAKKKGK